MQLDRVLLGCPLGTPVRAKRGLSYDLKINGIFYALVDVNTLKQTYRAPFQQTIAKWFESKGTDCPGCLHRKPAQLRSVEVALSRPHPSGNSQSRAGITLHIHTRNLNSWFLQHKERECLN